MLLPRRPPLQRLDPAVARDLTVVIVGGPSGTGLDRPDRADRAGRHRSASPTRVRFLPPLTGDDLPALYRAADLVAVPSYNESFGLVALEAQACGTPVVAAAVGGLVTAVRDGVSGVLVDGHDPVDWARVLGGLLAAPGRRALTGPGARRTTPASSPGRARPPGCSTVYGEAVAEHRATGWRRGSPTTRRSMAVVLMASAP